MTNAKGRGWRPSRAALVIGLSVCVAACGSYDDDDSPGDTVPQAPATTVAPTTEPDYGY